MIIFCENLHNFEDVTLEVDSYNPKTKMVKDGGQVMHIDDYLNQLGLHLIGIGFA